MASVSKVLQYTVGTVQDFTLVDADGDAVDLSSATLALRLRNVLRDESAEPDVDVVATTSGVDPTLGQCRYTWASGDLDVIGIYDVQIVITDGSAVYGNPDPKQIQVMPSHNQS